MKKSILTIGKTLNKTEQRSINGGNPTPAICNPITNQTECVNTGCLWLFNRCIAPKPGI